MASRTSGSSATSSFGACGAGGYRKIGARSVFWVPEAAGSPELDTLENKCFVDPDPKQYRLACKAKIKGPVKLGIAE